MLQLLHICEEESEKFNAVQSPQLPDDPMGNSRSEHAPIILSKIVTCSKTSVALANVSVVASTSAETNFRSLVWPPTGSLVAMFIAMEMLLIPTI
jgi:hypothetical protein